MLRSLEDGYPQPGRRFRFLGDEQKQATVSWQECELAGAARCCSACSPSNCFPGADAILFFRWRQPRFGSEKFHGAVMPHNAED